jgi:hypothetical protein
MKKEAVVFSGSGSQIKSEQERSGRRQSKKEAAGKKR